MSTLVLQKSVNFPTPRKFGVRFLSVFRHFELQSTQFWGLDITKALHPTVKKPTLCVPLFPEQTDK